MFFLASSFICPVPLFSRFQKMPNGTLVIKDVTTDDTGKYTCVAGNSCSIKDRVAQLFVVGELNTHIVQRHTDILHLHRLSLSGTKVYAGGVYRNHKQRMKAFIKPSPFACHLSRQVNNYSHDTDATAVTEVMGLGRC